MSKNTTAALFQSSLQTTDEWLEDIMKELGWDARHKALIALRATLHATRERLPMDECAQLTAQLPLIVKGLYWDGWDPHRRTTLRHREEFLDAIHSAFQHDQHVHPDLVARAVYRVMARHVSAGEMEDIRGLLPQDLRDLLPQHVHA